MPLETTSHLGLTLGRPAVPRVANTNLVIIDEAIARLETLVAALPAITQMLSLPFVTSGTARVPIQEIKGGLGIKISFDDQHNLTLSLTPNLMDIPRDADIASMAGKPDANSTS
jgi:hypothetical protein